MAYEPLNFENFKTVLTAEQLNHMQDGIVANGTPSWNNLTDRPFYDESEILYNGYPEIAWGYAIIPDVVLRDGVSYIISRQEGDVDIVHGSGFVATKDSFDNVVIEYDNAENGFRLEMGDDGKCYFFPNGSKWQEGREDGEEVYTSKYGLKIRYKYQEDAGVKTIDPKFLPAPVILYADDLKLYYDSDLTKPTSADSIKKDVMQTGCLPMISVGTDRLVLQAVASIDWSTVAGCELLTVDYVSGSVVGLYYYSADYNVGGPS